MKNLSFLLSLSCLSLFLFVNSVLAKDDERPKGLADKGPLTKITFIHYKNGEVRPQGAAKPKASACYSFLSGRARWSKPEDYQVNPTGAGIDDANFVLQAVASGAAEWERYSSPNIFGQGTLDDSADYNANLWDNHNVAAFGSYPDPNVIAVTTVWGFFSGPPQSREIVEWDMLFNNAYHWGDAASNPALMDLQNIATHELGHSAGLADLYTAACQLETMYGYSGYGQTIKRTLNSGDILGIQSLYR